MLHGKRIVVVMPAYNAAETLRATYEGIPPGYVDAVLVVDDASFDATASLARSLGLETIVHPRNCGYGGNQKTCYRRALELGADVVVMLHPDYQYTPKLVVAMASLVAIGQYDVVLGSRILCGGALRGGMPLYKYVSNRFLTFVQNLLTGAKLSEYHTGYRAFSRRVLAELPLEMNSDNFVFDNQMLCQALYFDFTIGEISCPARYFPEASSIRVGASIRYGLGVLWTTAQLWLQIRGLAEFRIFRRNGSGRLATEPCGSDA
ncbi:MAG: glycosyltransferase family 2 protein [Chloroflexi bacterium]|nr:glycosyltransferase family 2 protein [Chloroflexota bacterium]